MSWQPPSWPAKARSAASRTSRQSTSSCSSDMEARNLVDNALRALAGAGQLAADAVLSCLFLQGPPRRLANSAVRAAGCPLGGLVAANRRQHYRQPPVPHPEAKPAAAEVLGVGDIFDGAVFPAARDQVAARVVGDVDHLIRQ